MDNLKRIKYLIEYNVSKTSKENLLVLEQPDNRYLPPKAKDILKKREEQIDTQEKYKESQEQLLDSCKYGCAYPEYAVCPPENSVGAKGKDAMIAGYCYYTAGSYDFTNPSGIFLQNDAYVLFWTNDDIQKFFYQIKEDNPNMYTDELQDELLMNNLKQICVLNSVRRFVDDKDTYLFTVEYKGQNGPWEFIGYGGVKTKEYYIQPKWVDNRTQYQKFVDEWGFGIQISAAIITAVLGAVTEGATWTLTAEIITEMGFGIMVGQRELEKGENVSATLSFLTGALPFLKMSKWFRGIPKGKFKTLSQKLKDSGLTENATPAQLENFYKTLDDDEQKILSKLLGPDEITRREMISEVSKIGGELEGAAIKQMQNTLKNNPDLFKSLTFWDKLWARELTTNGVVMVLGLVANVVLGEELNDKDREILDGIYVETPEGLKKELTYNLGSQPQVMINIVRNPETTNILKELAKDQAEKSSENATKNYQIKMEKLFKNNGGKYVPISDKKGGVSIEKTGDTKLEDEFRKKGYVPQTEFKGDKEQSQIIIVNGIVWMKEPD